MRCMTAVSSHHPSTDADHCPGLEVMGRLWENTHHFQAIYNVVETLFKDAEVSALIILANNWVQYLLWRHNIIFLTANMKPPLSFHLAMDSAVFSSTKGYGAAAVLQWWSAVVVLSLGNTTSLITTFLEAQTDSWRWCNASLPAAIEMWRESEG